MKYVAVLVILILAACTPTRTVFWNFASQKDIARFPANSIEPADQPFEFHKTAKDRKLWVDRPGKHGFISMSLDQFLANSKPHKAFMIIKNDSVIYDHFAEGVDEYSRLTYFSVSKSVISMLIGIAFEAGDIRSLKDTITTYIPELEGKEGFDRITIEHLLKHTSGIRFRETYANPFSNDVAKIYYSKSLYKVVENLEVEYAPGAQFHYSSVNTQLLAMILMSVTGTSVSNYLEEKIWKPIGATRQATWSTYEKEPIEKAFCCLNASPIDLAKVGRLALKKGNWDGNQIVSETWFDQSLERSTEGGSLWRYQWHWLVGLKEYGDFMAQGLYDQYIYVMPKKDIVIISINDFHNPKTDWPNLFRQIVDQL